MKKTSIAAILCLSLLSSHELLSMDGGTPPPGSGGFNKTYLFGGGAGLAVLAFCSYKLYGWATREPSNEELTDMAQDVYDKIHGAYGKSNLIYYPKKLEIKHNGQLFTLVNHKDIRMQEDQSGRRRRNIECICKDLPQLKDHIAILSGRMTKDQRGGKPVDYALSNLLDEMKKFRDKLDYIKSFWDNHSIFFETHSYLTDLSEKYKAYDYRNVIAVRMQIRGDSVGKGEQSQKYPFKTFVEIIARDMSVLERQIKRLQDKMKFYSEEPEVAANYYNMVNQAQNFHLQLKYLRDVVADLEDYKLDVSNYEKEKIKREELAIKKKEAEAKERQARAAEERNRVLEEKARKDHEAQRLKTEEERMRLERERMQAAQHQPTQDPWKTY